MKTAITIAAAWAVLTAAAMGQADYKLTEAPESCRNAAALLVASDSANKSAIWNGIKRIADSDDNQWKIVDDYEPGVVRKLSLREYDTSDHAGGTAYIAHCGYGGTCNSLAKAFHDKHPDWYPTEVYCGPLPSTLSNPRPPSP
jgi:hypothetical protein